MGQIDRVVVEFLRTGLLLDIDIGTSLVQVIRALGMPSDFHSMVEFHQSIQKLVNENTKLGMFPVFYGNLEFVFDLSQNLTNIKIFADSDVSGEFPTALGYGAARFFRQLTRTSLKVLATEHNITSYHVVSQFRELDRVSYLVWFPGSQVEVVFDLEDDKEISTILNRSHANSSTRVYSDAWERFS